MMTRKAILAVAASLLLALPGWAQLHKSYAPTLKFGITAGLNIEKMWVGNAEMKQYANKVKPGFFVGPTLFYNMPATGLGFDLSVLYDQRAVGSKTYPEVALKSQTLQVPLNLRFGINIGDMVTPFIFAGPQIAFNVGKKEVPFINGVGASTGHDLVRVWEPKGVAMSLNFGIGILAMEKVQARVSYNLALRRTGWFEQVDLVTGGRYFLDVGRLHSCQIALTYFF